MKENLYKNYQINAKKILKTITKDSYETFRQFKISDLRFRVALDTKVSIETNYSDTKSKSVREVYELEYVMLSYWNVLESFLKVKNTKGAFSFLINEFKNNADFISEVNTLSQLLLKYYQKHPDEFNFYIDHFMAGANDSNTKKFSKMKSLVTAGEVFTFEQTLLFMYGERNSFYHAGETAKFGLTYSVRKKLLLAYIETLQNIICIAGAYFASELLPLTNEL